MGITCRLGNHEYCPGGEPGMPGLIGGGWRCSCKCHADKREAEEQRQEEEAKQYQQLLHTFPGGTNG